MARVFSVSDSITVGVSPDRVYDAVSRPSDMGRWSPENLGTPEPSSNEPAVLGTSFIGLNRRGRLRWTTRCTVTAADPGRRFAFRVHAIGLGHPRLRGAIATWEYRFEPVGAGTRVTEIWTDDRRAWPTPVANAFDRIATAGSTFAQFQARNIAITLHNLKEELESEGTS
ncbi:SRPBCC family protein [Streptomyces aquilus]|uniref:SRPBCC family protein n=1 Tax=Streptomyces aquilus TaxID=2548456 RepID=UPI00367435EE